MAGEGQTDNGYSSMNFLSTETIYYNCVRTIKYIVLIAFLSSVRASAVFPVDCRRLINFGLRQRKVGRL